MSIVNGPICSTNASWGDDVSSSNQNNYLSTSGDTIRVCNSRSITSATAPGYKGEICFDSNAIYVCIYNNSWKKVLLTDI